MDKRSRASLFKKRVVIIKNLCAGMAKLVDAKDLKSFELRFVPVRVRLSAPAFAYPGLPTWQATAGAASFSNEMLPIY